jgi:hypothetical protein
MSSKAFPEHGGCSRQGPADRSGAVSIRVRERLGTSRHGAWGSGPLTSLVPDPRRSQSGPVSSQPAPPRAPAAYDHARVAKLVEAASQHRDARTAGPVGRRRHNLLLPILFRYRYQRATRWLYVHHLGGPAHPQQRIRRARLMRAHTSDPDAWTSLFVAEAGVAAVLAGLLVVAVSINLAKILQHPGLPDRAAEAIGLLTGVLVASTLGLVPGQPRALLGAGLLTAGVLAWSVQVGIHLRAVRRRVGSSPAVRIGRIGLAQAAVLPLPAAGLSLLLGPAAGCTGWSSGSSCAW